MPLHEYLLSVGQKAAAAAAKTLAAAERTSRKKTKRAAMPAESLPKGRDNATSSHDMHDMPDTAFGVQHAAAIKALRERGEPVNYGSVIRQTMRSTFIIDPLPQYDPATDTPAHHARESCLRRLRTFKILDEMYPDSRTDAD
jgi:hypothetical protein